MYVADYDIFSFFVNLMHYVHDCTACLPPTFADLVLSFFCLPAYGILIGSDVRHLVSPSEQKRLDRHPTLTKPLAFLDST